MAATCTRKHETLNNFIISRREKLCLYELFETTCSISYKLFFQNYLLPNKPCIFSSSLTKDWPCRRDWVCEGAPNFAVLRTLFGRLGKLTLYAVNNEFIMLLSCNHCNHWQLQRIASLIFGRTNWFNGCTSIGFYIYIYALRHSVSLDNYVSGDQEKKRKIE